MWFVLWSPEGALCYHVELASNKCSSLVRKFGSLIVVSIEYLKTKKMSFEKFPQIRNELLQLPVCVPAFPSSRKRLRTMLNCIFENIPGSEKTPGSKHIKCDSGPTNFENRGALPSVILSGHHGTP
ncbi:hypothetical protein AVEN_5905-1 [Araneus ventricosus]|uniref:Uncharacterized protein n=1 Tax=Araneus ventricosus TaxID=182803 RepID=A0A4Y2IF99_ARAVE|nr:hypothetical protein AVEN_5905-1 [Araneus ventricosus]